MAGVDGVELNLSCANVWGPTGNKAIAAEYPALMAEIFAAVANVSHRHTPIAAKVAPNDDISLIADVSRAIAESNVISQVIVGNAKGGQRRLREDGTEAIAIRFSEDDPEIKHTGALGGSALAGSTPILTKLYRDRLPPQVGIISLGGISCGEHAWANLKSGAIGIMSTTAYIQGGASMMRTLLEELATFDLQAA
jgi:dihydroorotate dehydrogenase